MEVQLVHMFSFPLYICVDCLVVCVIPFCVYVYVSITVGFLPCFIFYCLLYINVRLKNS